MSNVLAKICTDKQEHVAHQKSLTPLSDLKAQIHDQPTAKGFISSLQNAGFPAIIAEIKKASPSKGTIRDDFNPVEIAGIYEANGAAAISCLTDTPYFQGSDDIFLAARKATSLPMLRKDFMVDLYQIYESRALGADCILLIMAALEDDVAKDMYALAIDLGMDTLFEVHDKAELERALDLSPQMLGVNNRNLKTLDVDVQTSIDLAQYIPDSVHKVAESGLANYDTLTSLKSHGYETFLIGESLMRQSDIGVALKAIKGIN